MNRRIVQMDIAIVGGGAAGFFTAIAVKENYPGADVTVFEKTNRLLSKVKISGGGRCNVTNGCASVKELSAAYPRGGNALKKAFRVFNNRHAMQWFESRGVPLVIQEDNCVFPVSQTSQSIIDCFIREANRLRVRIEIGKEVRAIHRTGDKLGLSFKGEEAQKPFDKVIVATGGCPGRKGLVWLEKLNHRIEAPVPSLFSFRLSDAPITELHGIVVEKTFVGIQGTRLQSDGPLLITHWGLSGPAILKLSSLGARVLSEKGYNFMIRVNWAHQQNHEAVTDTLKCMVKVHSAKFMKNERPFLLPERLWLHLLEKSDLPAAKRWGELGIKGTNKLVSVLTNDIYAVSGRAPFKEEFVTCGGVSLKSIDVNTMQSKVCNNLYFAGEILDIDGITGGYNFQAAWTTAFIAARLK